MAPNTIEELEQLHRDVIALKEEVRGLRNPPATAWNFVQIVTLICVSLGLFVLIANERHTAATQRAVESFVENFEVYETP